MAFPQHNSLEKKRLIDELRSTQIMAQQKDSEHKANCSERPLEMPCRYFFEAAVFEYHLRRVMHKNEMRTAEWIDKIEKINIIG